MLTGGGRGGGAQARRWCDRPTVLGEGISATPWRQRKARSPDLARRGGTEVAVLVLAANWWRHGDGGGCAREGNMAEEYWGFRSGGGACGRHRVACRRRRSTPGRRSTR
ncbi:uncharacterized protein M6B38_411355 [Iris pallida]|uniref:Uncharacterized protein n=1 Tax=Iris pallida TaxID=29817 RepID=A0AAX6FM30_IRIPA|nr:uncharacterized protein M6B38_411355 [Iris pallida]